MSRPWMVVTENDLHAGSSVAAVPPEGVRLDDGGYYKPSKLNEWLWGKREETWAAIRRERKRLKARLVVTINGDLFEGSHHGTTQILSGNPDAQNYVAGRMMDAIEAADPDKVYIVRGTDAHVGEAGSDEEAFAKAMSNRLPVIRDPDSHLWSYWNLWAELHGTRLQWTHHTRMGGLPWTQPGAVTRLAFRIWAEYSAMGWPHPHLAFRAHVHQTGLGGRLLDSGNAYPTRVIVVPPWQAKTGYAHRQVPDAITTFGSVAVVIPSSGPFTVLPFLTQPDPPLIQKVV